MKVIAGIRRADSVSNAEVIEIVIATERYIRPVLMRKIFHEDEDSDFVSEFLRHDIYSTLKQIAIAEKRVEEVFR